MNADMLAAGVELGDRYDFDLVHGHDWLVAVAGDHLANRFRCPFVTTIHATEYGRHQGWVDKHPQSWIHGVERWMANRAERVITCSHYMREHVCDIYGIDEDQVSVIPNGIDPMDLQPVDDLDDAARALRRAGREARPARRPARLREGLPARARRARADRQGPGDARRRALPRRRLRHARGASSRSRRASSACSSTARSSAGSATTSCTRSTGSPTSAWCRAIYEPFGLVALEAMAERLPVHRRRHRRPA